MEKNGAGGEEISKIRHLGPKQRHFGLSKKKIYISVFVSITEKKKKKKSPRASLRSSTMEKMEKKKKKKEKKNPKMHGGASRLRHAFDNYD